MTPPPATPPRIPDYELLKAIGRGSYGEVWLARSVTGVFRVIKLVRRDRFEDERPYRRELEGISRFQAAVSGRPRQLALLHVGRNDAAGYFYYVMEPADDAETGSAIDPASYTPLTLRELFARRGRLPAAECVQLALELARGLAVLHAENLIHRDIKPSNIIFVQRVPKLADVGLVATSDTAMTCVGTPGYAPPEGPGTVAADLFGLGKVLYEIATGLDRLEYPRLPSDIADSPDAPLLREINSLVLRTCDRDPKQRPASAEAFARDLELIQAGQSVAFYEGLRRRFRLFAIATAFVAVVAASVAALVVWRASILSTASNRTRHAFYKSDLAVAQLAQASGDLGRARAALARQIPAPNETDLRHLEWYMLLNSVRGDGVPLEPATNGVAVSTLTVSASGRWLAAGFADDTAAIWDLHTGHVTRRLQKAYVLGGFTPDDLLVVDEPDRALRFESPTNGLVRRIETGMRLYDMLRDGRFSVITPEGDLIVSLIKADGSATRISYNISQHNPEFALSASALSADGLRYVLGLYKEEGARRSRRISVVDYEQATELWHLDVVGRIPWIVCSPDNRLFLANIGGVSPTLFDLFGSKTPITLRGHPARVEAAAFSPDATVIATVAADQTLRTWRADTGEPITSYHGMNRPGTAVSWIINGSHIITGDDQGQLLAFAHPQNKRVDSMSGYHADVNGDIEFSPDSKTVAISTASNSVALVSIETMSTTTLLTNIFQPVFFTTNVDSLSAFTSDWQLRTVSISNNSTSQSSEPIPKGFSVATWCKSAQKDKVVVLGSDGSFLGLNLRSRTVWQQREPSKRRFWAASFSTDGTQLWTANSIGQIRQWRSSDGSFVEDFATINGEPVAIEESPASSTIAVGVAGDSSIRILDRSRRTQTHRLLSHRRFITVLCFTPDGARLISGGTDGKLIVWRTSDYQEIAAFDVGLSANATGDEGIAMVRSAPNWSSLAALTEDGRLRVWRINESFTARAEPKVRLQSVSR